MRTEKIKNDIASFDAVRKTIFYPKTDVESIASLCAQLAQTREHDLALYQDEVRNICLHHFGTVPLAIVPMKSGGTFHVVYKVQCVDGQWYVVRLNRLKDLRKSYEFLVDEWVYETLKDHGLACSSIVQIDCSRTLCSTDYELLTYVEGRPLTAFEDPQTQFMKPELLQAVGNYVARYHCITLTGCGPLSVQLLDQNQQPSGVHSTWLDYILVKLPKHIAVCGDSGAITGQEAATIERLFNDDYRRLFEQSNGCLLHGDLGNHNFISADGATVAGLIDWEDCMSGDSVFDIAFWGTFFKDHMRDDFLIGYQRVRQLPADFELRYWLYYLRIALSKTVHRIHFGYTDKPGRQPASLRIQKALAGVRKFDI